MDMSYIKMKYGIEYNVLCVCVRYGSGENRDGSAGHGSSTGSGSGPEQHLTTSIHNHQRKHIQGHDPAGTPPHTHLLSVSHLRLTELQSFDP